MLRTIVLTFTLRGVASDVSYLVCLICQYIPSMGNGIAEVEFVNNLTTVPTSNSASTTYAFA